MIISVGDKKIGPGEPCYIIAEAGSNHNRDFQTALRLIQIAAKAGANAVKFQTYTAEKMYSSKTPVFSDLQKKGYLKSGETIVDLIRRIQIPLEWHDDLAAACRDAGVHFLSTPFDEEAVRLISDAGAPALKVASFEIVHIPLLAECARTGLPILISTGMASLGDIELALETIAKNGKSEIALFHCTSNYPVADEDVNLRAMETLRAAFGLPVGISDHSLGIECDLAAAAMGANMIEKHFTKSRNQPGPDHGFALEPDELCSMCSGIRRIEKMMGGPQKRRTEAEEEYYQKARRSLIAATVIPQGTIITNEMVAIKRPGTGIHPEFFNIIIGRRAQTDIEADQPITWEMV